MEKGDRYGKWTILGKIDMPPSAPGKRKYSYHRCLCDCGEVCDVLTTALKAGRSTQCSECRKKNHGDKMRVVEDGVAVIISFPEECRKLIKAQYGAKKTDVGRCVRDAIKDYRKAGEITTYQFPEKSRIKQTSIVVPRDDWKWLKVKHRSVQSGIYNALCHYLEPQCLNTLKSNCPG